MLKKRLKFAKLLKNIEVSSKVTKNKPSKYIYLRTSLSAWKIKKADFLQPAVCIGETNAINLELLLKPEYYAETLLTYKSAKAFLEKYPNFFAI